jgi:hypothetical protein
MCESRVTGLRKHAGRGDKPTCKFAGTLGAAAEADDFSIQKLQSLVCGLMGRESHGVS